MSQAARNQSALKDWELFRTGKQFRNGEEHGDVRVFQFEADILEDGPPKAKQLRAAFYSQLVNEKHFVSKIENPRPVTVAKDNGLAATRKRIDCYHEQLGLPKVAWPEYDTPLDKQLHDNPSKCPFCDSAEIEAGDYDGSKTLTCEVGCRGCGGKWGEKYAFVGGWVMEKPPENGNG